MTTQYEKEYSTAATESSSSSCADSTNRNGSQSHDAGSRNGSHQADDSERPGAERCEKPEHDQCNHGSSRAEKRRAEHSFSPEMGADLAKSGLTAADAEVARFYDLTHDETLALTGQRRQSYGQPYFDLDGRPIDFYRLRFLDDGAPNDFKAAKSQRYWQPKGTPPHLYFAPFIDWRSVLLTNEQLYFGEGAKKALKACRAGLRFIGLDGVWSFKSRTTGQFDLLDEIKALPLKGKDVCVIFDSDVSTKPQVLGALHEFARQLANLGARPSTVILPSDGVAKISIDDYLMNHGVEAFKALPVEKFSEVEALWEFNTKYAVIEEPTAILKLESETLIEQSKFTGLLVANQEIMRVNTKGVLASAPAGPAWIKWKGRRQHSKIVYEPGLPRVLENGDFNLWRGFGYVPRKPSGDDLRYWNILRDHLFPPGEVDPELHWYLQWCAYPFQHPGVKLISAVVMFGRMQGSGKSLMGEVLAKLYGTNGVEIGPETLGGNFNEYRAKKQFCLANEIASRKDLRLSAEGLKILISQSEVRINEKYAPAYMTRDCVNWYMTSNHYAALYMDDDDRRYFPYNVERKLDPQLGYEIGQWKNNADLGPLLYHLLYEIDTTGFLPTGPAYESRYRKTMIEAGGSDMDKWAADLKASPMPFLRAGSEGFVERRLWRTEELAAVYRHQHDMRPNLTALGNALHKAKFLQLPRTETAFGNVRLWDPQP